MSSEAPSNENQVSHVHGGKRTRIATRNASGIPQENVTKTLSPTEAGLVAVSNYVVTLHQGMQTFTKNSLQELLKAFSTFYYRNKKHKEMTETGYIPKSCNFNLPLIATRNVGKSEDYNTLTANLSATLEGIAKQLAPFVIEVHELNRLDAWKTLVHTYVRILASTARTFVAQFDLVDYNEHQAIMDLVALHPGNVLGPIGITTSHFLKAYRNVNGLAQLPNPSVRHSLGSAFVTANNAQPNGSATTNDTNNSTAPPDRTVAIVNPHQQRTTIPPTATPTAGGQLGFVPASATPRTPTNPYLPPSATRHAATNQAIADIYDNGGDMMNEEQDREAPAPFASDSSVIQAHLLTFLKEGILAPIKCFKNSHHSAEVAKRIKKATKPAEMMTTADRIAATIAAERPVEAPVLRGLVREEGDRGLATLRRELQSIKAQLANKTKPSKNSKTRGNGKAAGKRAPSERRPQLKGQRGNDTAAASKKNAKRPSNTKSVGNKRAQPTKKRS